MARPYTSSVAAALFALALGVTPAVGQSARATVRASATVLDPVGVRAPASLVLRDAGSDALTVDATLEVTSPVPHVLSASESHPGKAGAARSRPCAATRQGVPRRIRAEIERPEGDGPVRITYTVAVVL